MKWSEVTEHPAFKSRSAAEQEATREEYFREVVAPKFAPDQLPAVRQQFDADTRIRKQDLPAGVAPSTRGAGLATAFEKADPRRTDVADPSKTFGQGQGLAGVMSDIRGNEAARTQRLTTFKGASGDTYTDPTAPSTTPEGASVLDQPPPQSLAFVDASRMQRDLTKRADAALQTRMAGTKIGPATPDQVQAMDLNESGAGPVNRGARAGFAQMGQIGLGAMRMAGDLVGSDTVSGIATAGSKAAGAFEQGAMQGLEGGEKLAAQVTSSIMNSLPAMAMGVAGGPALRTLFAQSTLSEYNAGRDAGFSVTDSLGRAGIMGFGEALGEKFGLSEQIKLIKSITKGLPQGELAKVVGSLITKEIPGEQLTTAIQFMADKIGPAALKPNATLADYLEAAADTLKVTVGQMAVMGGGPAAINAARNTYDQANQAAQAPESAIARELNDATARYAKFFAPAPEEAAAPTQARASSIKRFDEAAAAWGLNPKAAAAVREQAGTKPADDVPGFLARAMAALNKRGMFAKPVDDAGVAALDARLRGQAGEPPAAAPAAPMAEPVQQAPQAAAAAPASPEGDFTGLDTPSTPQAGPAPADAPIAGEQINRNWTAFAPESGTLSIPREQMPQISAEHRGALVQFLKSRGIEHQVEEVDAASLKPTQAEFSPKKVQAATDFTGGNRSILVSADGYILDGTHQWLSAREAGRPVKTIRLNAPIQDLLRLAHQFPSSTTAAGPRKAADGNQPDLAVPAPVAAGAADSGADQPGGSGGNVGPLADAGLGLPRTAAAPVASGADPAPAGNGAQRDAALNDLQAGLQQLGGLLKPKATAPATDPTGDLSAPEGARTPPEAVAPQDLKPAAGMTFSMDGKRYTVKKAYDTAVSIEDEAGKVRNISRISEVWPKMLKAMAAEAPASRETKDAAAPAQQAPAQARVPDAAAPASAQVSAPEIPVSETDKGKPAPAKPKVYKTRAGAEAAKAGNTQRLKKVQGGYILRQATDKEMEAADKAGKRLAGGAGVDVERDSLLQAIAKLGGISLNERSDTIGEGNRNIGGKMLFTSAGRPLDELARNTLRELGYVPKGEVESDGGVRWLRDAIKSEFMGTAKHHSEQGSAWMEDRAGKSAADMSEADLEAARAAYEAEQADAVDDGSAWANGEDSLAAFTPEDLQEAGYTGLSPVEQAEVEQLLAEAESLGIDTEALREDAARLTAEESADAYHAEVKALLRGAIAAARAAAAGTDAAAARQRGPGDGQPAGDQGQEGADEGLILESQSAADLQAKADREEAARRADADEQRRLAAAADKRKRDLEKAEKDRRAAEILAEREAAKKAEIDAAAESFELGQEPPKPVDRKVSTEQVVGQRSVFDEPAAPAASAQQEPPPNAARDFNRARQLQQLPPSEQISESDRELLGRVVDAQRAEVRAAIEGGATFESIPLGFAQDGDLVIISKGGLRIASIAGRRSRENVLKALQNTEAASAQQVPDDGPTPNYKAGDRITPDKDVMEGDVVKYRGAEWMAKVKRGIGIPLLPMVDGKPQVSADTKKLVDVKANEVIHTGTNVYGYGGQPKPSEKPETPAESKAIPKPVQDRVRIALQSLRGIEELLSNIQRARGNGHILALEWKDQQENMAGPLAKIAEFRALAGRNGIDAESVIEKLGGMPDLERFNVTPAAKFGKGLDDTARVMDGELNAAGKTWRQVVDLVMAKGGAWLNGDVLQYPARTPGQTNGLTLPPEALAYAASLTAKKVETPVVDDFDAPELIRKATNTERLSPAAQQRAIAGGGMAPAGYGLAIKYLPQGPEGAGFYYVPAAAESPAAQDDEATTFTEAQARKQFEWRDLGQKDGTKTHGLFFFLKPEDKGTGRAMGRGQVTRYEGSNGWQVDSEGQKYPALADAKKAAIDAAIPVLREQGWISGDAAPALPTGTRIEPSDSEAVAKAKADLMAGLGDLAGLLSKGTRKNITPEEEQQLLPILTKVMDAAFRLGYLKFKDAAKFVLDQIRDAIGNDAADVITLQHVQGAYIGASSKYLDRGADPIGVVATFASLSDLGATAAAGVEAAADQVNSDSLGADTKNRANLNRAQLGGVQSSGEVGVDALRRVYGLMRSAAQDPQILKPIVSLVPVEVVDVLRGLQLSPEALFNDPSVLERLAGFGRNAPVPGGVDAALAVMKAAAAFAAKAPRATELAKGASDLDAAVSTLESRQSITPNSSVELGAESDATNSAPPILRPKNGGVAQPTAGAVENFGEALPPSRRQRLASLDAALSDDEIEAKPLSEIWPLAENDAIEDKFAAAVANTARASIPAKPRKGYKLDRWVDAVKVVRQLAQFITSGKLTREQFIAKVPKTYALEGFMSKVALLDAIGREHWKRIGEVREHPGAYTFENGQKVPTPQVSVTIDGKHHWLRGGGSVADHIASVNELLGDAAPEKRMEFEVRGSGSSFGINKKGDSEYRRLMEFATADEAIKAKREKYADLVKAWDAVKDRDNVTERDLRSDENKDRIGPDYRKGRDISGDEFDSTFGFKGGEFGKWVSQGKGDKERQWMLNRAYDALMDLAGIVGVSPRAISLNGTLGIAFGSRGTGWASAHFEPGNLVINLTKTRGAGALAHEWFHALDNYFARARGGEVEFTGNQLDYRKNNYVTYKPEPMMVGKGAGLRGPMRKAELERRRALQPDSKYYAAENWQIDPKHPLGVRPEVEQRFADLVKALDEAPMTKRAAMIDKASGGSEGYWSRIIERAARSFESYVIYRMMEKGQSNEYLANVTKFQDFVRDKGRYPYPTPEEIKPVADAFGALFGTIQTRTDDAGNVAMFSRAPSLKRALTKAIGAKAAFDEYDRKAVKVDDAETYFTLGQKLSDAKKALRAEFLKQPDDGFALRGRTWSNRMVIVNASAQKPGHWQITRFDGNDEPWGDSQYRTKESALDDFMREVDLTSLEDMDGAMMRRGIAYAGDTTAIQQAVDVITDQWENAPPVTVVHSMQDSRLPQAIRDEDARQRLNGSTGEPTGVFFNGRVYIVASAVRNDAEVARVLFHDGLGHFGLRGAFGSSLDKILDQMATLNRPAVALKAKEYGFDMANQAQRRRAAEEVLAELAETRPTSSWVQKAIAAIRTWLRENLPGIFGELELSDAEIIRNFIAPARGFVERGQAQAMANATPVFTREPDSGIIRVVPIQLGSGDQTWVVTRNVYGQGSQHLGYFNTEQEALEAAERERTEVKRGYGGRQNNRWWTSTPSVEIQSTSDGRLDSVGRAAAVSETLAARADSIKSAQQAEGLEQIEDRAGWCFASAAQASAAGLGDMVIGRAPGSSGNVWHAVVQRDGAIYDPTFGRWFEPGIYEQLGFDAHTSLVPDAVRDFIARTGGMAPDSKNLKLDDEPGNLKDLTRLGEALAAQGYKRTDIPRIQASRKLAGLIKRLDEGKITPEAFEVAVRLLAGTMDRVVGIKTANRLVTERERGADILREKLIRARRTGALDADMVEFALWALDKNPDLASNLGISVRTPGEQDKGAAGDYNPTAEIIRLFKGSTNDDTAVHEILHHAERMMPPDMQAAIRKEWARTLAATIKRSTPAQVEALMNIGPALAGDRAAYRALMQSMNEGPLTFDHYQLINPSEYWAVNGSRLMRHRFDAKDAVWKRIANWLFDMGEKLRAILGLQSDTPIIKALNYVTDYRNFGPERGGRFESEKMLSDRKEMMASGDVLFSRRRTYDPTTTEALKRAGIGGPPSAREKIRAHWDRAMQLVTDRNELAQQMRQGTLDQFAGIQRALRRDVGNLPAEQDPYIAARLANGGTSSVMRALLLHGQAQWAANGQHLEKKPGTKGLLDILKPLGDDVNDWFGWMVGNRAARLMSEGRENNFTADQIKALQALATPEKKAAFQKAAMEYTAFKRSVLDLAQAAGLINPESRKAWDHADYIPFYRQVDERSIFSATGRKGLSGQTSGIRTLKGGEAALNDPLENLLMNFSRLVDASLKNNAINRTIRALEEVDSTAVHKVGYDMTPALVPTGQVRKLLIEAGTHEAVMDAIPEEVFEGISKMWSLQQPTDPAVVRVMRGGKPAFYRVDDPLLLQSLTSFVPLDFPGLGMMRAAKRLLTATVTATPEFMLRNFIRDSVAAQAIARDGFNPAKSLQGIAKSFTESGGSESMLFAGASFQSGNVNAANPEATGVAIRRSLRSKGIAAAMAQNGFTQTLLDTGAKFWEKYREVGEAIENANREAVYEAATKEGKSATAAAYEAKDLMDFSLRGSWAGYQLLADVLPFFNARVQGLYRVGRADPKRLATVGLMLTAASLLLAWDNDGEDWYEELPDWDKDTYWHFRIGKQHFRIPKPFELGVIFATIPERIGRSIKGLDSGKKTGSRLWANVRDQLAFDPVPQLARPVLNVWANKDSFRDAPIESMSDEGKLPHLRYSARTSDTMRALTGAAPGLSDASGLSPKKLEYLLGGYLGTAGLYALALSDMLVRQLEGKPPGPSLRADDLPVVKAFYRVDPARATVFESDLYKMRAEVDAIAKSIKASAKDNPEEAARLQTTEKDKLAVRNMVVNAAKSITTLNRQRDQIYADKTMPPDEKRKQVDELQRKKNALAKQVAEHPMVKAAF